MTSEITLEALQAQIGSEARTSHWILIDQPMIDAFAGLTDDHQFIHVDPDRAADGPFGATIAHGFLTLSLLAPMRKNCLPPIAGQVLQINYGFDKVRFLSPVRSGKRIRGHFRLTDVKPRGTDSVMLTHQVTVEIEGEPKPALLADWLGLVQLGPDAATGG